MERLYVCATITSTKQLLVLLAQEVLAVTINVLGHSIFSRPAKKAQRFSGAIQTPQQYWY